MKIGFDQVRFGPSTTEVDLTSHAEAIIASNRAIRLAKSLGHTEGRGGFTNPVVAGYGIHLERPLAIIIRHSVVFDAAVLPFEKKDIRDALLDCAKEPSFNNEELALLGDLHSYLSHFIAGLEKRGEEDELVAIVEQQAAECSMLRAEWLTVTAHRRRSRMSRFLSSWLKPDA